MTIPFNHGEQVCVVDSRGNIEARGAIVGCHRIVDGAAIFDIQPRGELSLKGRICGIHETRIRRISPPVLAYEKRHSDPQHIKDSV